MDLTAINKQLEELEKTYGEDLKVDELIDPSTRLPNKRALERKIVRFTMAMIMGKSLNIKNNNTDTTFSVIYCDISNLKILNDKYDHVGGDYGILKIIHLIKQDLRENDFIFRLHEGGDEFVIILPRCTKEQAGIVEERITNSIENDTGIIEDLSLAMGIVDTNNPNMTIPEQLDEKSLIAYFWKFINLADKEMKAQKLEAPKNASEKKKISLLQGPIFRMYSLLGLDPNDEADRITFNDYVDKSTDQYLRDQSNMRRRKEDKKEL